MTTLNILWCLLSLPVFWAVIYIYRSEYGYLTPQLIIWATIITAIITFLVPAGIIGIFIGIGYWFGDPNSMINRRFFRRDQ